MCDTSCCLKVDMTNYQLALFDTYRRHQAFGLQFMTGCGYVGWVPVVLFGG
jgi:hypothetical protein